MNMYEKIRARRIELGLTQSELAKRAGYSSKSAIAYIEQGRTDLTQSKIRTFAEALEMTPSELMGWSGDEPREIDGVLENGVLDVMQAYIALPTEQKNMIRRMLGLSEIR